jgi:hypothetical protein
MKSKILGCTTAIALFAVLAIGIRLSAQELQEQASVTHQPTITEFDALGAGRGPGSGTFPQDNNSGSITGYYINAQGFSHGFLRTPDGTVTTIDPPGTGTLRGSGQGTIPEGINGRGEITGYYQDENNLFHGFLRAVDGTFTTIDSPNAGTEADQGTAPQSINSIGTIAGFYLDVNNTIHGFVRTRDGVITTFDAPGAGTGPFQGTEVTTATGINPEGAIVGWYIDISGVFHGYLRSPDGAFTTIDPTGTVFTVLAGITPDGTASGYFGDASNVGHGFVRSPDGTITTFDDPDAAAGNSQGTFVFGINPAGAITGQYTDSGNTNHGFVRSTDGKFTTFDPPFSAGRSIALGTRPVSINAPGAIAGFYLDKKDVAHGFLWTP